MILSSACKSQHGIGICRPSARRGLQLDLKHTQEKWKPVFRPGVRKKKNEKATPGKVEAGFPSGCAKKKKRKNAHQEKWKPVFRSGVQKNKKSPPRKVEAGFPFVCAKNQKPVSRKEWHPLFP